MHLIIYSSEYTGDRSPDGVRQVLTEISGCSKDNNRRDDITGILFYYHGMFLQFIEGDKVKLMQLMARLAKDDRHCNVARIVNQPISERGFGSWDMPGYNLEEDGAIDEDHLDAIIHACEQHLDIGCESLDKFHQALLNQTRGMSAAE